MRALKLVQSDDRADDSYVTTQAHEGIETQEIFHSALAQLVTTQAHEGIETLTTPWYNKRKNRNNSSPWGHWNFKRCQLHSLCFVNRKSSKSEGKFPTFGSGNPHYPKETCREFSFFHLSSRKESSIHCFLPNRVIRVRLCQRLPERFAFNVLSLGHPVPVPSKKCGKAYCRNEV